MRLNCADCGGWGYHEDGSPEGRECGSCEGSGVEQGVRDTDVLSERGRCEHDPISLYDAGDAESGPELRCSACGQRLSPPPDC